MHRPWSTPTPTVWRARVCGPLDLPSRLLEEFAMFTQGAQPAGVEEDEEEDGDDDDGDD